MEPTSTSWRQRWKFMADIDTSPCDDCGSHSDPNCIHTLYTVILSSDCLQLQYIRFTCRVSEIVYLHKWCISCVSCIQYHMISLEKLPFIPWISHWITLKKTHENPMFLLMFIPWYPPVLSPSPRLPDRERHLGPCHGDPRLRGRTYRLRHHQGGGGNWGNAGEMLRKLVFTMKNDDLTVEFWDSVGYIMEYPLII